MLQKRSFKRLLNVWLVFLILSLLALPALVAADTFVLDDKPGCEALGGTWSGLGQCVVDSLTVNTGDTLVSKVWLQVNTELEISGKLANEGVIDLIGRLEVGGNGTLDNQSDIQIRPSGEIENNFLIENSGRITNGGSIMNKGIIDNKCVGEIIGSGSLTGNEPIHSPDSFICSGERVYLAHISAN